MIKLALKKISINRQMGLSTLVISTLLLVASTLIVLLAASYSAMQKKTSANQNRNTQAFEAAEAGLEYGVIYLQQNSSTITANPVSGHINYTDNSITNVSQGNGSKYSIQYTNPTANNYDLIQITTTGSSDDNTSTRVVSQQVQKKPYLSTTPTSSLVAVGTVSVDGSASVANTTNGGVAIQSGGQVTQKTGSVTGSVQQNISSLSNSTSDSFFNSYFGATTNTIKSLAGTFCTNTSTCTSNGSSVSLGSNTTGIVWVDSASELNDSVASTIGSAQNPVILIINGDLNVNGNITINGVLVVLGNTAIGNGTATINGTLLTTGSVSASGNISVSYNSSVVTIAHSFSTYVKIPGSWKDF